MTIALPISAGRSGFTPDLALTYDSGNGNGPFGVGWRCELPSIGRKLDQRLPRYDDTDTFVLTGHDDLVPVPGTTERDGSTVQRYRSRTETSFERVERWTAADGAVHWRTIGTDNVTTMFGTTEASRVGDGDRVVTWLASARWDDRGNALVVDYVADDDTGIAMAAHEQHRTPAQRAATRYLATIRYGNRRPNRDASGAAFDPATIDDWLFSLVFDYGDHDWSELTDGDGRRFVTVPSAARRPGTWPARPDPFSTYRAGFELRTSRLCRRVLMFHHLPDQLGRDDTLVRSLELTYDERPALTRLVAATENGHVLRDGDRYLTASFPTVTLAYTDLPDPAVLQPATVDGDDVCAAVLDPATIWTDLDGDGAAGLLEQTAGALWYRRNSSPAAPTSATFAPRQLLDTAPWRSLHDGGVQLLDIDGDGQAGDLAVLTGPTPTYARRVGRRWEAPGTFDGLPADALTDAELRWLDLDGDGRADIARSDGDTLTWFAAQGTAGFTPGGRVALSTDEDAGLPHLRADRTQAVLTADMTGDGLADLVRRARRRGVLLAEPRLRPVRGEGDDVGGAALRRLRPGSGRHRRRRRLGHDGPGLRRRQRHHRAPQRERQRLDRAGAPRPTPVRHRPDRRARHRPARHRHGLRRRPRPPRHDRALPRPDGRHQAAPAHRADQRHRAADDDRVRPVDHLRRRRCGRRRAVVDDAAVPRPRRPPHDHRRRGHRHGADLALRLPRRLLRRRRTRAARLRHGRAVRHRAAGHARPPRGDERRRRHRRAADADAQLVPHRRARRRRQAGAALRRRRRQPQLLPRAGRPDRPCTGARRPAPRHGRARRPHRRGGPPGRARLARRAAA